MAEKVVAGSVPIATATSMRPSRTFVRVVAGIEAALVAGEIPPEVWAMMSTLADLSDPTLRNGAKDGAPEIWVPGVS